MIRFLSALLLAGTAASTAIAADAIDYSAPVAPSAPMDYQPSFSWTGPYAGAQLGYGWVNNDDGPDGSGVVGGVHAGYNYDLGGFVVGGEADYDFAGIELDGNAGEVDGIARAKLKGGVGLGRALPYFTAGGAYARGDIAGIGDVSDIGWLAGGGADYAVTDQVVLGGEYLYHSFDNFDDTSVDLSAHTLRAKASFKF